MGQYSAMPTVTGTIHSMSIRTKGEWRGQNGAARIECGLCTYGCGVVMICEVAYQERTEAIWSVFYRA